MEVGKQIRNFRKNLNLSQEDLADKIFVTRQTVSNWEKGKNYPDLKSLVMLSQVFSTSLDILVKGDVNEMRKQVIQDDVMKENYGTQRFKRDSTIFTVLLFGYIGISLLICICIAPIADFDFFKTPLSAFETIVFVLWVLLIGFIIYYAYRVEKQKRELNIKTFREILDLIESDKGTL